MSSKINAISTGVGGLATSADNSGILEIQTNDTTAITVDASQNVGIGTSSPTQKLDINGSMLLQSINKISFFNTDYFIRAADGLELHSANTIRFLTNGANEQMRIDASGRLLVGTIAPLANNATLVVRGAAGLRGSAIFEVQNTTGSFQQCQFVNPNGVVGAIFTNGTATSYVTSSDYRLKENIAPMTGALSKVTALKPVTYTWKTDGKLGQGFIAHELQAIVPDCVHGEKDAVDEKGNPIHQGIDTSFLVATLTAAIQEQQAIIKSLTARIEALEGVA